MSKFSIPNVPKISSKTIVSVLVVLVFVVALIGAFTFLKPQNPSELINKTKQVKQEIPFEKRPGISNVKTFSDARKNRANRTLDRNASGNVSEILVPRRTPKPLPYPRIEINYTSTVTDTIGGMSANELGFAEEYEHKEDNNTRNKRSYKFLIIKLDIRNYGYKYFDANPTRFKIVKGNRIIEPIVNVSTGDTIDAVVPNNSRAKGDVIFLLKPREPASSKIKYKSNDYKILFKTVTEDEMEEVQIIEDEDEGEVGDKDDCEDYDYEEDKCYD